MFELFRQTVEPSIICAVPADAEPPHFLNEAWTFERRVPELESQQLAFDRPAVQTLVRRNGFYLYARL